MKNKLYDGYPEEDIFLRMEIECGNGYNAILIFYKNGSSYLYYPTSFAIFLNGSGVGGDYSILGRPGKSSGIPYSDK